MVSEVRLLPSSDKVLSDDLLAAFPGCQIYACDFYVIGIEHGAEVTGGYQLGRITNIDHHAPTSRMSRKVSSANLAIERVGKSGPADPSTSVVINHTDCDSVLSSSIMAGGLPPDQIFGEAAIAADHTGEENDIADLLQALDHFRDLQLSLRNLRLLLNGRGLETPAIEALAERKRKRAAAGELVVRGHFQVDRRVAFTVLGESIDGEFFPALLPGAAVILIASLREGRIDCWDVKLRLGNAAPDGLTLHTLKLAEIDPRFGGRWNAGSNKRGGGTTVAPDQYAEQIKICLARCMRPS